MAQQSPITIAVLNNLSPISLLALVVCTVVASYTLYNAYLHPLARFPGPFLAGISRMPRMYYVIMGEDASWPTHLHRKYGPVVRIAPNELSFVEPKAWRDIYGHRTGGKHSNPKDPGTFMTAPNGAQDIIKSNDVNHSRYRKAFSHSFSDRALRAQEALLKTHVDKLIDKLMVLARAGTSIDLAKWYNFTTFDIMGDLTFAEPLGLLDGSDYTPWVKEVFNSIGLQQAFLKALKEYPMLHDFVWWALPKFIKQKGEEHFKFSSDRVTMRLKRGTQKPDIWSQVLDKETDLTIDEMHSNASIFMGAGTETTAALLSGLTYHLLKNPAIMDKLQAEIRGAFPSSKDITVDGLLRLEYLQACVDEGLRMYPPASITSARIMGEASEVCGKWLPQGTKVGVPQYAAYHYPGNFKEPDCFIPERWMGDEKFADDKRSVVQAFSHGPRNCIGKNLAYHETRIILSSVLRNFDLTLCPESDKWIDHKVYMVWNRPPLMCKLRSHYEYNQQNNDD